MATSLLDLLMSLLNDPAEKAAFQADPAGFLQNCGLQNLSSEDIHDAIQLAGDDESHGSHSHGGHLPPPPPVHHEHGDSPHDAAVKYLNNYITNNYVSVDARETNIDNSVHQDIDASHGGHVFAPIDVTNVNATGDHSAAVGGDNNGNIATGDGAVAGTGNQVAEGNTDSAVNFGAGGSAVNNHGATASDGGAIAGTGGAAGGDHTATTLTNFGSGSVANAGSTANQADSNNHLDSHNTTDTGHNTTTTDTGHNTTTTDSHDSFDDHAHLLSDNSLTDDHSLSSTNTDSHDTHIDHNPVHVDIPAT